MAGPGTTQRAAQAFIVFENFEKMDTAGSRQGLPEKSLAWQENLQAIAQNKLVTVPHAAASPLATLTENVLRMFNATINGVDYDIVFTTAGAGFGVQLATGTINQFAADGTFTNPDMTVWQAGRILINDPTSGYCTWDGTTFVKQGGVSPVFTITNAGAGYATAPAVTISGGSGTGATAHSEVSGGSIVAIILDNPGTGYQAGDTLTVTIAAADAGSGATGHAVMTGFDVADVVIASGGSFSSPTSGLHACSITGGGGSGATADALVTSIGGGLFTVSSVFVNTGGTGYTSAPACTLSVSGGTAPTLIADLGTEQVDHLVLDAGGSGYASAPTVTISGGGGSGATAHSALTADVVTSLTLDTAGAGFTTTADVIIGNGADPATATGHVWPFVPDGTTLDVFGGRVWLNGLSNGNLTLLQYTGTQGYDDFDSANAAGSLVIADPDLVHAITAIRARNNYLFIMGDQSVKQIGNISLNTAGDITLFTILTLSSDQGTIYPLSCISFNRVFMFANKNGVYAVFGSSVQKISSDMDGIWSGIDFTQSPQAAIVDLNGIHNVGFLIRYADPFTSTTRSLILTFNGQRWFVLAQGESLVAITTTSTLASGQHQLYGSSGADITQLISDATVAVGFRLQTSLSHHGNALQNKKMIRAGFGFNLASGSGTITQKVETEGTSSSTARAITSGFHVLGYADSVDLSGIFLGMTLTGTLKGLTLTFAAIEMQENALWPNK